MSAHLQGYPKTTASAAYIGGSSSKTPSRIESAVTSARTWEIASRLLPYWRLLSSSGDATRMRWRNTFRAASATIEGVR